MSSIGKTHNLAAVSLIIGGVDISGYGEDGGIEYTEPALFTKTVGADGEVVFAVMNDQSSEVDVTLGQTTRAYMLLAGVMQTQLNLVRARAPIAPLSYLMFNPITGDKVSAPYVVFLEPPAMDQKQGPTNRVFKLALAGAARTYGLLNII